MALLYSNRNPDNQITMKIKKPTKIGEPLPRKMEELRIFSAAFFNLMKL